MQMGLVGNVQGTLGGGNNCTLTGVDLAIYDTSAGNPSSIVYSAYVQLNASQTFSWGTARSGVLHFDIVDLSPNSATQTAVLLTPGINYWARIKLNAPLSQNGAK
jgi:hypothetical protein